MTGSHGTTADRGDEGINFEDKPQRVFCTSNDPCTSSGDMTHQLTRTGSVSMSSQAMRHCQIGPSLARDPRSVRFAGDGPNGAPVPDRRRAGVRRWEKHRKAINDGRAFGRVRLGRERSSPPAETIHQQLLNLTRPDVSRSTRQAPGGVQLQPETPTRSVERYSVLPHDRSQPKVDRPPSWSANAPTLEADTLRPGLIASPPPPQASPLGPDHLLARLASTCAKRWTTDARRIRPTISVAVRLHPRTSSHQAHTRALHQPRANSTKSGRCWLETRLGIPRTGLRHRPKGGCPTGLIPINAVVSASIQKGAL